uniref:GST C-terminal domain-containing protein n=1 Tax=Homalodisca liturata TaxID=320908 RepID=A0A1B6HZ22_9HEMI
MPLVLYYLAPSPPARTVNLVLHALDLPVEYKTVDLFKKEHLAPEFLKGGIALRNEAPTPELIEKVKVVQENIEKLLTGNKFMAGDTLTVADYSFITLVDLVEVYCPPDGKFPLTKEWVSRCQSSMKDFEKANKEGSEIIVNVVQNFISKS